MKREVIYFLLHSKFSIESEINAQLMSEARNNNKKLEIDVMMNKITIPSALKHQ